MGPFSLWEKIKAQEVDEGFFFFLWEKIKAQEVDGAFFPKDPEMPVVFLLKHQIYSV
jgi:hypothetical protein